MCDTARTVIIFDERTRFTPGLQAGTLSLKKVAAARR